MDLAIAVKKYLEMAGEFGKPVHLSALGLPRAETEKLVSAWDDDYQISRYLVLTRERDEALKDLSPHARVYLINSFEVTHLSFHPDIQKLL